MGVVALRNPTGRPAQYALDLQMAFELPSGATRRFTLQTPWKQSPSRAVYRAEAGRTLAVSLAPWEVVVLESHPAQAVFP
jgi:hypothetical protein